MPYKIGFAPIIAPTVIIDTESIKGSQTTYSGRQVL